MLVFSHFYLLLIVYLQFQDAMLNAASPVLRLTRAGETVWGPLPGDNEQNEWSVFESNHSTYEPLSWAYNNTGYSVEDVKPVPLTTVVQVRMTLLFFLLIRKFFF